MCYLTGTRFASTNISMHDHNEQWMNHAIISCNLFYLVNWHDKMKSTMHPHTPQTYKSHFYRQCHLITRARNKTRHFIIKCINCSRNLLNTNEIKNSLQKIQPNAHRSDTTGTPADRRTNTIWWTAGNRAVHSLPAEIAGTLVGDCQEPWRSLPGHLLDVGWKFYHLGLILGGVRTVSCRRSSGDRWVSYQNGSRLTKSVGELQVEHGWKRLPANAVQLGRYLNLYRCIFFFPKNR